MDIRFLNIKWSVIISHEDKDCDNLKIYNRNYITIITQQRDTNYKVTKELKLNGKKIIDLI